MARDAKKGGGEKFLKADAKVRKKPAAKLPEHE